MSMLREGDNLTSSRQLSNKMMLTSGVHAEKKISNALGTLDRVIQEKKIFTALAKMPDELQSTLLRNGWIGKDSFDENSTILSLHKNSERVKTVVKRYESGLIWMDENSRGVNWSELHPTVVVNRFPRDANVVLKLCGQVMAGKSQFDSYYPRAYPVAEVTVASRFTMDYLLTACTSLLRAFVNESGVKCSQNGQVPLSAIRFAVEKCEHYAAADDQDDAGDRVHHPTGDPAEWRAFLDHYYRVVDDNQKLAMPADGAELHALTAAGEHALRRLAGRRPQMAMDGLRNLWTIKCDRPNGPAARVSNRIDDIVERCDRVNADGGGYVVQKYVETPLLSKNDRFDVRAWLVVSTLDDRLAVWLYQTCCVDRRLHRLPADGRAGQPRRRHAVRGPVHACGLRQLKGKLRAVADAAPAGQDRGDAAVWQAVRRSVASSALAAAGALNLRPNCLELFEATFAVGDDFRPWLIDIESDPWIARGRSHHHHAESSVAAGVARGLAKLLIRRRREPDARVGMFELLHRGPVPGDPYEPRAFTEKPVSPKRCERARAIRAYDTVRRHGHDEAINTYVETIRASDPTDDYRGPAAAAAAASSEANLSVHPTTTCRGGKPNKELFLNDLEESMARLRVGSAIDPCEAKYCLNLLDKWKTKVMSAQRFYKTVRTGNGI